jgi:tetraacyldisaccharide 4'-kinase
MARLERFWFDDSLAARIARAALTPAAFLYGTVVRIRGAAYDRGVLQTHASVLPVLSIGNLSVGGTGKTPMAAWAAQRLRDSGSRPAILLRGYGGDETLVHAALNPDVPVIANADRVAGVEAARAAGADVVILDDGFQHRRLRRTADWVLVAAESGLRARRLLPAGPLREPASALARAQMVVVTRKSASVDDADSLSRELQAMVPQASVAVAHLAPSGLVNAIDGSSSSLEQLRGARMLAVAAIGAPDAFFGQLRATGVAELRTVSMRDHHEFTASDVDRLVREARGMDGLVCTLKDAVKLAPQWSATAPPLWYVSQRAEIERGAQLLDDSLSTILSARAGISSTAGAAG